MDEDDDFTGLFDANLPRADLVGAPANGVDEWLVMKGAQGGGLLDADFVRDLIAKEDAVTAASGRRELPNGITLAGSPAAMAAFIHAASVRKASDGEDVAKEKHDTADRKKMASSGAAMPDGSYPIADRADLGKAIQAVGRGGSGHDAIRKHIISRARSLGASSEIPDNWNSDGSLKEAVSKEAGVADQVSKDMGPELDGDPDVMDAMDVTVPLAEPGEMAPGDPTVPGSPAWESIDAASAQKWLSVAARLKNALCILAEREMLEAASADPDDIENAWDLEDAKCAVEYAIGQLAVFAAGEQAEAELGAELEAIGKALAAFDTAPLGVIEGLAEVRKAGRVLSSANEAAIRAAAESLQKAVASLPEAPVAKSKEGAMPATATAEAPATTVAKEAPTAEAQAAGAGPVAAGGTTGMGEPRKTGPAEALPADGPQKALPGDVAGRAVVKSALALVYDRDRTLVGVTDAAAIVQRVAKADGDGEKKAMQAVFDQDGDLIGIVDPDAIQPVTGAGGKPAAGDGTDGEPQPGPAAAAADDMTPQPAADAGTPADEVGKATATDVITVTAGVLESTVAKAVAAALGAITPAQDVAKADVAGALAQVELLKARIAQVEQHPAAPGVFTNGAVPPRDTRPVPPAHQLRGQDQGQGPVLIDVAKAREMKQRMYTADPAEANRIATELNESAIAHLQAIHSARQ